MREGNNMSEQHYFACGNTAKGFRNLFETNLNDLKKIYILKGGPGTGKSTLMKKVGKKYVDKGYEVEFIHCSSDPDSLDGVIVRKLGFGIVDGTAPHVIEPRTVGAIEEYINLGIAWNIKELESNVESIKALQKEIAGCYPKAYQSFSEALQIHDRWERIYIENMNFEKANKLTESVCQMLLEGTPKYEKGTIKHRFFGGSTPYGPIDYVETLIDQIENRFFIKGRPGTGKSTMLKKILAKAEQLNLDVEVYHCGFDPDSLDMLIFRQLGVCIFDSTEPHLYQPTRNGDWLIDMYKELVKVGTDESHEEQILKIKKEYKEINKKGIGYLAKAKNLHDELEQYYIHATDYNVIEGITNDLLNKLENL